MPASRASTSAASHPVSTTGEKAMMSTPCWMNWRIDSIWLSWSPWASVNFRSIPASAAASWIDWVLAVRQPLSAPTWAKPIEYPLRSGITIEPPTSAVAAAAVSSGGGLEADAAPVIPAALASVSANAHAVTLFFNTGWSPFVC